MNLGEMLVRFSADTGNFTRGAEQVGGSLSQLHNDAQTHMGGFASAIGGGLSSLLQFGANAYLTFQGIAQGFGLLGHAFDAFKEGFSVDTTFQNLNAQLTAITGSGGSAQKIMDWIKQFGQTVPDTTEHLAEATVTIESLGLNAESIMPSLANIAAAMGVDLPTAAQAFADAYQGRFEMLQMSLHVNKEELVKYGLDLNNVQGTLATALANFQKAKLPDGLKEGMSTLTGQLSNLTDRFQFFAGKLAQPIFNLAQQGLQTFFGFLDAHQQLINTLATDIGGGLASALQQTAGFLGQVGQAAGGLVGPLGQVWQQVQGLASQAFGPLSAILRNVGPAFQSLVTGIETGNGPFGALAGATQTVGQAFGQFLAILQSGGKSEFASFISDAETLGGAFAKMLPGLVSFGSTLASSIVPAALSVIGALVQIHGAIEAGLAKILPVVLPLVEKLAGFLEDNLGKAVQAIAPKITEAAHTLADFASQVMSRALPAIQNIVGFIQNVLLPIWQAAWPGIEQVFASAWQTIQGVVEVAWSLVSGIIKVGLDLLGGNWGQAWTDMQSMFSGVWDGIQKIIGGVLGAIGGYFREALGVIGMLWNAAWSRISSTIGGILGQIGNTISGWVHTGIQFFVNLGTGIWQAVQNGFNLVKSIVQNAINFVVGLFQWLYDHNTYFADLVNAIVAAFTWVKSTATTIWNDISGFLVKAWRTIQVDAAAAWLLVQAYVINPITNAWHTVQQIGGNIIGALKGAWNTVSSDASSAWNGFIGLITGIAGKIGSAVQDNVVTPITNTIQGLISDALTWGQNLINMFIQGIENMMGNLQNTLGNVAGNIGKFLGFHSPPPEGPASDSDTWAPNMIDMMIAGLDQNAVKLSQAAANVASQLQQPFVQPPTLQQLQAPVATTGAPGGPPMQIVVEVYLDGQKVSGQLMPRVVAQLRNAGIKI